MKTPFEFYQAVYVTSSFSEMNRVLNIAIKSKVVSPRQEDEYNYNSLCEYAKSKGFRFGRDFFLLDI